MILRILAQELLQIVILVLSKQLNRLSLRVYLKLLDWKERLVTYLKS